MSFTGSSPSPPPYQALPPPTSLAEDLDGFFSDTISISSQDSLRTEIMDQASAYTEPLFGETPVQEGSVQRAIFVLDSASDSDSDEAVSPLLVANTPPIRDTPYNPFVTAPRTPRPSPAAFTPATLSRIMLAEPEQLPILDWTQTVYRAKEFEIEGTQSNINVLLGHLMESFVVHDHIAAIDYITTFEAPEFLRFRIVIIINVVDPSRQIARQVHSLLLALRCEYSLFSFVSNYGLKLSYFC